MRHTIAHPRYALALFAACAVCLLFADGADARGYMSNASAERAVIQWNVEHGYVCCDIRRSKRTRDGHTTNVDVRYYEGSDDSGPIDFDFYFVDVFEVQALGHGIVGVREPETYPRLWKFKLWPAPTTLDKYAHAMGTDRKGTDR